MSATTLIVWEETCLSLRSLLKSESLYIPCDDSLFFLQWCSTFMVLMVIYDDWNRILAPNQLVPRLLYFPFKGIWREYPLTTWTCCLCIFLLTPETLSLVFLIFTLLLSFCRWCCSLSNTFYLGCESVTLISIELVIAFRFWLYTFNPSDILPSKLFILDLQPPPWDIFLFFWEILISSSLGPKPTVLGSMGMIFAKNYSTFAQILFKLTVPLTKSLFKRNLGVLWRFRSLQYPHANHIIYILPNSDYLLRCLINFLCRSKRR